MSPQLTRQELIAKIAAEITAGTVFCGAKEGELWRFTQQDIIEEVTASTVEIATKMTDALLTQLEKTYGGAE